MRSEKIVWILNHYAQSPNGAGGTRHFNLAHYLRLSRWSATLIASSVEHPSGRQRLLPGENIRFQSVDGVSFVWLKTDAYIGNGQGRIKNMLQYVFKALALKKSDDLQKPDLIIGSSVHPFAGLAAWWLSCRFRVPFVFEVRDLWPQTLIDMGRLQSKSLVACGMRVLERFLYWRAERIITLMPFAHEYIEARGVDSNKIVWIPNGVDLGDYPESVYKQGAGAPLQLMYFGSHGEANDLNTLVRAMGIIKQHFIDSSNQPIHLRLVGDGPGKKHLIELAFELGLDHTTISFENSVNKRDIPRLAQEADAFVITVRDLPDLYRYGISMNKIFDYMAAAKPIVIASSARNNPIADAHAGFTVEPENPQALAEAIIKISVLSAEERAAMGRSGRTHVEELYSYDKLSLKLAQMMDSVLAERL